LVRGTTKRKSKWTARLSEDSFEETEHGQGFIVGEFMEPEPIEQVLGCGAGRECIGQAPPTQQETEAQHDFALEDTASGKMPCEHQRVGATSSSNALRLRMMPLSYHSSATY
jgi:hypothetical protein